jgi:hypothetical protein
MLEGQSKIRKHPYAGTLYVTIPANIAYDSAFPLKEGNVKVTIENGALIIRSG